VSYFTTVMMTTRRDAWNGSRCGRRCICGSSSRAIVGAPHVRNLSTTSFLLALCMVAESRTRAAETGPGPRRSRVAALRRLPGLAIRRLGWGVADQMASSLTNFAVSIYVVRTLGAVQFGVFSLAYVTYSFALNASRGLATDPLMVRFSATNPATWRRAVARCTGTALVVGFVIGACAIAAAEVIGGTAGSGFLALGLTLPGLMLQDSWRYSFFALGRGHLAFLNDLLWGAMLLPALVLLRRTGHADVFWFLLAWGATAGIAAAIGPLQAHVVPKLPGVSEWLSKHRDLGTRYLVEGTASSVAGQLRIYSIGLVLGLAAVGYVQAANTLTGPMQVLFLGMLLTTIPEAARVLRRTPRHMPLFCMLLSGGLAVAGLVWGAVLLFALPRGLGNWLLGPTWRPTYPLVVPQTLYVVGLGASLGGGVGLHALAAARRSLRANILGSAIFVVCSLLGAVEGGTVGTMYGAAIAAWTGAFISWRELREGWREYRNARRS
jgi:O-antigen/teichoic acid export membrane protein